MHAKYLNYDMWYKRLLFCASAESEEQKKTWDALRTYCAQSGNTSINIAHDAELLKQGCQIYACEQVKQAINETRI